MVRAMGEGGNLSLFVPGDLEEGLRMSEGAVEQSEGATVVLVVRHGAQTLGQGVPARRSGACHGCVRM